MPGPADPAPARRPGRPPATLPPPGRRRPGRRIAVAGGLAALLLLGACSGGWTSGEDAGRQSAVDGGEGAVSAGSPEAEAARGSADAAGQAADAAALPVTGSAADRRIRRAQITLRVDDLAAAASRVRQVAADLDGYVSDEAVGLRTVPDPGLTGGWPGQEGSVPDGSVQEGAVPPAGADVAVPGPPWVGVPGEARLVLRVPEPRTAEALDSLAVVGVELNRWSSEQVVEGAIVDLDSRVATQTRSVERVRALLQRAESLEDVLRLEQEVARREGDLEALQARRDALAQRAASATVTAVLRTAAAEPAPGGSGFLDGLAAGWRALTAATAVLATAVGAALPFVVVAGVAAAPVLAWSRRRRRSRPSPADSPG